MIYNYFLAMQEWYECQIQLKDLIGSNSVRSSFSQVTEPADFSEGKGSTPGFATEYEC